MAAARMNGACHCGAVQFRVTLPDGFDTIRRCTCSYCRMRGAIAVSAKRDDLEVMAGSADSLTLYQFGSMTAKHYFCSKCGIYTHHQRRSNPAQYGINVACLEGVSPFDFAEVPVNDGVAHPNDTAADGPRIDGILRYERKPV
jgi:hypothetical protein